MKTNKQLKALLPYNFCSITSIIFVLNWWQLNEKSPSSRLPTVIFVLGVFQLIGLVITNLLNRQQFSHKVNFYLCMLPKLKHFI